MPGLIDNQRSSVIFQVQAGIIPSRLEGCSEKISGSTAANPKNLADIDVSRKMRRTGASSGASIGIVRGFGGFMRILELVASAGGFPSIGRVRPGRFHRFLLSAAVLPLAAMGQAPATAPRAAADYGKLPLSFEANQGQTDPQVKFLSRGNGYSLFLTDRAAVLALTKRDALPRKPKDVLNGAPPRLSALTLCPKTRNSTIEQPQCLV